MHSQVLKGILFSTLLFFAIPSQTAYSQTSVGAGVGTGLGAGGVSVQFGNFRGAIGRDSDQGFELPWWEISYLSVKPGEGDTFFWKIGGGVVSYLTVESGGELTDSEAYYGGTGMAGYKWSISDSMFINLAAGISVAEEEVPLVDSQVLPALEASLNLEI